MKSSGTQPNIWGFIIDSKEILGYKDMIRVTHKHPNTHNGNEWNQSHGSVIAFLEQLLKIHR